MKHKVIYSTSLKKKKEVKRKKRQKCTNKKNQEKNSKGIKHFTGKKYNILNNWSQTQLRNYLLIWRGMLSNEKKKSFLKKAKKFLYNLRSQKTE